MNTVSEKDFVESMKILLGGQKNAEIRKIIKELFAGENQCQSKK